MSLWIDSIVLMSFSTLLVVKTAFDILLNFFTLPQTIR